MWCICRCTALLDKRSPFFLVRVLSKYNLLLKSVSSLLNACDSAKLHSGCLVSRTSCISLLCCVEIGKMTCSAETQFYTDHHLLLSCPMGEGRKTGMFENKTPTTPNPTKPHKQKNPEKPHPNKRKHHSC